MELTTDKPQASGAIARRRLLERIELLCDCGAGLEAIASPLTAAVRDWIGAQSGSLFWLDEAGNPTGFFHDCAPAEIKDLFVTQFERLFSGPDQVNMVTLAATDGPSIGRALDPAFMDRFWAGNVYRHLCVPLDHRHLLDIRIEVDGAGRAVFCAWNPPGRPFTHANAEALVPVQRLMRRAVADQRAGVRWRSLGSGAAHLITDPSGTRLVAINDEAEAILKAGHLLRQHVSMTGAMEVAPGFATLLAHALASGAPATACIAVPDGRIVATASKTRRVELGEDLMFVALDLQVAVDVLVVDYLMALALTPLQKRIALFAARGGSRLDCGAAFDVGPEALKKHLRAIFDATGAARWTGLAALADAVSCDHRRFTRAPVPPPASAAPAPAGRPPQAS